MNDDELEQRLRGWYRTGLSERDTAPMSLRTGLVAIVEAEPLPMRRVHRRRDVTLLAAAALLAAGGAIAAGSALVHREAVLPSPRTLPAPSSALLPSRSPTDASPRPSPSPVASPAPEVVFTAGQDMFTGLDQFLVDPDGLGWVTTISGIYRTADAGATWTELRPPAWTSTSVASIVDAQTMYATSDSLPMTIAATHDGGVSWVEAAIDDPSIGGGPVLAFQTPMRGFATFFDKGADDHLRVYATTDGGVTWTGPVLGEVPVIEASMGKLDGNSGGVLFLTSGKYDNKPFNNHFVMSLDGGATWKTRSFPIGDHSPKDQVKGISQIWLDDGGRIEMAIFVDGAGQSIWSSEDDGRSWGLRKALPSQVADASVDFISPTEWVASLDDGSTWSTVDGGDHWRTITASAGSPVRLSSVRFASPDRGWAVEHCAAHPCDGQTGITVLRSTTDGGRTWTRIGVPSAVPTPAPNQPAKPNDAAWSATGTMAGGQFGGHGPGLTATLLRDGTVLVVGGARGDGSAELYDPSTGRWTSAGTPLHARLNQTATLLPDGRVLFAGGAYGDHDRATTEIYDPVSKGWMAAAPMHHARSYHQAIALLDGRVLIVGGIGDGSAVEASAELYDPRTGTWAVTGRTNAVRAGWTAPLVRLLDGRVLLAGGTNGDNHDQATAEVYDPAAGRWTATGSMMAARAGHTLTLLDDGRVLVAGGSHSYSGKPLPTAELYDPSTGMWSATGSMVDARSGFTATLLRDGSVLIAGGSRTGDGSSIAVPSAELYDPSSGAWRATAEMGTARYGHSATLLDDGTVLVAGGHATPAFDDLRSAELYQPRGSETP